MTNQAIFLIVAIVCGIGVFLNGLRFYHRASALAVRFNQQQNVIRRVGLVQMIAGPIILFFLIAIGSGLFGPVSGVTTSAN